jgi:hypothetical protein
MTKDEALDLALEALSSIDIYLSDTLSGRVNPEPATYKQWLIDGIIEARNRSRAPITAIKQARSAPVQELTNLQRHEQNVQKFLGAQPAPVQEPWNPTDTAYRPGGLPQDFIKHEVENEGDWSEWVNPKPEQYFMKCCDCGLVHEMQFKVAKYSEGDECEFVADANLQAVFRARRHEVGEKQEDSLAQTNWDNIPQAFNDWWNADYDDSTNPFRLNSPAYWAWSGWSAANKEKNK